jgi:membrane associated rhomboid family serine protease
MNEPIALCNALIIGVTCLVSWLGFRSRAFEEKYIFEPEAILAWKEYYRLLTSGFLHVGWWHLLVNMVSLYLLGRYVELLFGAGHFLLIYFGSIIGGNLLSVYVHRHHEYRAYGASGGVCGIIFAYILLVPGASISQFPMPFAIPGWLYAIGFIAVSFIGMKANNRGNIGHDAHLGGAIVGLLIAAALHPEMARANWRIFLLVLTAAVLLLVYLWINPMFLPSGSFFGHRSNKMSRSAKVPSYKREILEIDAVLEKISKKGMESLSEEERNLLANASAKSQRRAESKKPESGLAI